MVQLLRARRSKRGGSRHTRGEAQLLARYCCTGTGGGSFAAVSLPSQGHESGICGTWAV